MSLDELYDYRFRSPMLYPAELRAQVLESSTSENSKPGQTEKCRDFARRLAFSTSTWIRVRDANHTARAIFDNHYSRRIYRDGRKPAKFIGPGEYIALLTPCARALFVWRKFIDDSGQIGINCAIFRNEGAGRSSDLILAAEAIAWDRWPGERLYTYINPRRIRSANPGYCFLMAGWRKWGWTKGGLRILEKCYDLTGVSS